MTKKGTCSDCRNLRWLRGNSGRCKPCAYPVGDCTGCQKTAKIYVDGLCYLCYQNRQIQKKLNSLESDFIPASEYNRHLFQLYLIHIRRCHLYYHHYRQAKRLKELLEKEKIPKLKSWPQIYQLVGQYPMPHHQHSSKGKAFLKIGHMLQELGVLPIRREELQPRIDQMLNQMDLSTRKLNQDFLVQLQKSNRASATVLRYIQELRHFEIWLRSETNHSLLTPSTQNIKDYIDYLRSCDSGNLRQTFKILSCFYRFCLFNRKILLNPCNGIQLNRGQSKLTVCSEHQFKKLVRFSKNTKSDPEQALLICLILFFGLTLDDIAYATVQIESDRLCIVLRRKPRTKGRRFYNRDQILKLPAQPIWFLQLQKRFYTSWHKHHARTKTTYSHPSMVLPKNGYSNRPLSQTIIRKRIYGATLAATNTKIPPRVLRQTCGHIYTQNQDASILSRKGWSPQFAFHYTWLPRKYFSEKSDSKKI